MFVLSILALIIIENYTFQFLTLFDDQLGVLFVRENGRSNFLLYLITLLLVLPVLVVIDGRIRGVAKISNDASKSE